MFAYRHEPQQPGVLVRRGVDRDDLRTIDVDLAEDLAELIRHRRVAPEGAELRELSACSAEA